MEEDPPVKAIQTTDRILLEILDAKAAGPSELAKRLQMPKSTVYDHLRTLEMLGYIISSEDGYRLSTRFLDLGAEMRDNMELFRVAKPQLDDLAEETGMHTSLMIEENGYGVTLYTANGDPDIELVAHPGMRTELHTTSGGKALLSGMPQEKAEDLINRNSLSQLTQHTITDTEELLQELESIRRQGFALDRQEQIDGMRGIGTTVTDRENTVVGAILLYGPLTRIGGKWFEDYRGGDENLPDKLLHCSNIIEVNLTYS